MENSFEFYITSEGFTIDKSAMAHGVLPVYTYALYDRTYQE